MGSTSDLIVLSYDFIEDFIYWKSPERSMQMIKEAIKLPLILLFAMYFLRIRYFLALGLWVIAALSSPFCMSVAQISLQKAVEVYHLVNQNYFRVWFERAKARVKARVLSCKLPFTNLYNNISSYCRVKKQ